MHECGIVRRNDQKIQRECWTGSIEKNEARRKETRTQGEMNVSGGVVCKLGMGIGCIGCK